MKESPFKSFEIESLIDYAVVHEPNTKFSADGEYRVTLRITSDTQLNELKSLFKDRKISENVINPTAGTLDPRIKSNEDGTHSLTLKRPAKNQKGQHVTMEVVDAKGNAIPKNVLIGNGSKAVVQGFTYLNQKGQGVMRLSGIQILDLVPFSRKSSFKARNDGFEVSSTSMDTDSTDLEGVF